MTSTERVLKLPKLDKLEDFEDWCIDYLAIVELRDNGSYKFLIGEDYDKLPSEENWNDPNFVMTSSQKEAVEMNRRAWLELISSMRGHTKLRPILKSKKSLRASKGCAKTAWEYLQAEFGRVEDPNGKKDLKMILRNR